MLELGNFNRITHFSPVFCSVALRFRSADLFLLLHSLSTSRTASAQHRSGAAKRARTQGDRPGGNRFEAECATYFAEVVQILGVPKSVGQIYGLLYASSEPLSFSDIVVRLGISKGSASQGLQLLRSLGAINVAESRKSESGNRGQPKRGESQSKRIVEPSAINSHPHSHFHFHSGRVAPPRIAFEPELSLRKLMSGVIRERVTPLTADGSERLGRLRELAKANGEAREFCLDRVEQLATWRKQLGAVMPAITVLFGPKNRK